jgi:hydroxyethylthiazole kinase-like uncharacterized protein yjeF
MSRRKLLTTDNKYSRGVVAVCAGSTKYPGAALLAIGGARAGSAGYVKFVSTSRELSNLVVSKYPDVVPISTLEKERLDSFLVGPGGSSISKLPSVPTVLDSSAIAILNKKSSRDSKRITVITPHEGELKFLGKSYGEELLGLERKSAALKIAQDFSAIVVLKGAGTVVASPDGRAFIDQVGGSELATAGSGDVLAGLIASLLVEVKDGGDPFKLVCEAVKLHSKAGRYAAKKFTAVTAVEIVDSLHHV